MTTIKGFISTLKTPKENKLPLKYRDQRHPSKPKKNPKNPN
jgi:hypothetical protein